MALIPATFKANLKTDFIDLFTSFTDQTALTSEQKSEQDSRIKDIAEAWADKLSARIDAYIKTATVNTTVAVTSVAGVTTGVGISGPGSGSGTGSLT